MQGLRKKDPVDIARTSHRRANHLHQNPVPTLANSFCIDYRHKPIGLGPHEKT